MKLIIDANEIFSFFNVKSKARDIALNPRLLLYAPKFALDEIQEHREEIIEKFHLEEHQFLLTIDLLKEIILFVEEKDYEGFLSQAKKLSPDQDDADYFALAVKLNCPIWSEDKKLNEQIKIKIYSTEDLIKEFNLN